MHPIHKDGYSRGVGVFIVQDRRLLLTFRSKGEQPGVWEVVAGQVKEGESVEATAIREALEETGIGNAGAFSSFEGLTNGPINANASTRSPLPRNP